MNNLKSHCPFIKSQYDGHKCTKCIKDVEEKFADFYGIAFSLFVCRQYA